MLVYILCFGFIWRFIKNVWHDEINDDVKKLRDFSYVGLGVQVQLSKSLKILPRDAYASAVLGIEITSGGRQTCGL